VAGDKREFAKGVDAPKSSPANVARQTLDALTAGKDEVLADQGTRALKQGLSREQASYLDMTQIG
jgi:hypothetical protein